MFQELTPTAVLLQTRPEPTTYDPLAEHRQALARIRRSERMTGEAQETGSRTLVERVRQTISRA